MRRNSRHRESFLMLAAIGLLGLISGQAQAQRGGGGGHAGGGGGHMSGGAAGGVRAGGYGYHPGFGYGGYAVGYGGYGLGYGGYGYGNYGYGGYPSYGSGYGGYPAYGWNSSLGYVNGGYPGYGWNSSLGYGAGSFSGYAMNPSLGLDYQNTPAYGWNPSMNNGYVATTSPIGDSVPTVGNSGYGGGNGYYGGIGYGGYGDAGLGYDYYGGYGGLGTTIGLSLADRDAIKAQYYANNASRYNLQNAQAVQAYSSANYYNTAANVAASNMSAPMNSAVKPTYNIDNGSIRNGSSPATNNHPPKQNLLSRDVVMDADGNLRWPASAPADGDLGKDRQAVDSAIQKVVSDLKSKPGPAPIRDVVDARDRLYAYGNRAMQQVHTNDAPNAAGVARFLNSVDHALLGMGEAAAADSKASAAAVNKPDNAAKTAGDVLRDTLKDEKKNDPTAKP